MSVRALLFGGSGFIGSHLAHRLLGAGYDVTVLDVVPPTDEGIRYISTDVRQPIDVQDIDRLDERDVIYNLAAVHRTPGHREFEYYDTNVLGAVNVTQWAERVGASRLLFTSSIAVYGPSEEPLSEQSALCPNSAYGRSKLIAERVHETWLAAGQDRRLVISRPAVVFGRGEGGNFTRLAATMARGRFVMPGRRDTVKACGYVADLLRAFDHGLSVVPAGGCFVFNFCYPQVYTIGDICRAFSDVAGYPSPRVAPTVPVNLATTALKKGPPRTRELAERVHKLRVSTNIRPEALCRTGFGWDSDLRSALVEWRRDSQGSFC